jgi:hypothetical protein
MAALRTSALSFEYYHARRSKRKARFHQWLTDEGRTILTRQIGKVEGIMEMCDHIDQFKEVAKRRKGRDCYALSVRRNEPNYRVAICAARYRAVAFLVVVPHLRL